MQERKLKVGITFYPYSGNGGGRSENPDSRKWLVPTVLKAKSDPRVLDVIYQDFADTPAYLNRNAAVLWAKQNAVDVLYMIDSDQAPDHLLGTDPEAKPFWDESFNFIYDKWDEGPHVIGAPYTGPPPYECVYVFLWRNEGSTSPRADMALSMYTREHAAIMSGIQPCAALPTGCIAYDMRAFDLIGEPKFFYEYKDDGPRCQSCGEHKPGTRAAKASTEDVTNTRDISLAGHKKYGRDVVYCAWSSWAGHHKTYCCTKPSVIKADHVSRVLVDAANHGANSNERMMHLQRPKGLPEREVTKIDEPIDVSSMTYSRNAPTLNGFVLPVGAGPEQPEDIAKHLLTTDDIEQLDVQVSTSHSELLTLQYHVARESFKKRDKHMVAVEVGSFAGRSAVAIASGFEPGQSWEMHCVDHFKGTGTDYTRALVNQLAKKHGPDVLFDAFNKRIADAGLSSKVTAHRMSSLEAARRWYRDGGKKIDILFLDAGHTYEELKADIEAWKPHMAPDGLMMGHDYRDEFPGVKQAVNEAFYTATVIGSIWIVKCEQQDEPETMFNVAVPNARFHELVPSLNGDGDYATGE